MFAAKSRRFHDQNTIYVFVVLKITEEEPSVIWITHFSVLVTEHIVFWSVGDIC